ncbi:hypothetical protein Dimus_014661 [Dionaea muscipula]
MSNSSGQKSTSFSNACNLLSQYLREKRSSSYGDSNILTPNSRNEFDAGTDADECFGSYVEGTTMNLFPREAGGFGSPVASASPLPPPPAKMTIFYNGEVFVFDDLPAEKAKEIMQLASRASASTVAASEDGDGSISRRMMMTMMMKASDLPIARKGSLQRFFEKRKDRITARAAPYDLSRRSSESKSWLCLAPQAQAQALAAQNHHQLQL